MCYERVMLRWKYVHLQGSGTDTNHRDDEDKVRESVRLTWQASEHTSLRASGLRFPIR